MNTARDAVVGVCRHLADRGLSPGSSGNVSVRIDGRLLVTPTGTSLSRVRASELALVPLDGTHSPGPRPSKELPLHLAVYRERPGTGAVVHLHSPYAVAASCLPVAPGAAGPLPPLTPYQVLRVGDLPVAPYAPPGSAALAEGVARFAGRHAAVLLANHGSVTAAPDPHAAADLAEEVEAAAQLYFLLQALPHRTLTEEQAAELRGGVTRR